MRFRVLAGAVLIVASGPLAASSGAGNAPTGCDGRRAVVHHVGGATDTPQALLACSTSTGYAIAESHLNVAPDGEVIVTPAVIPSGLLGTGEVPVDGGTAQSNASPAALAVSRDQGAHWSLVKPSGTTWNPTDHGDYVDPVTGRLFFEDYGPIPTYPAFGPDQEGPAHLNVSADGGKTWAHSVVRDVQLPENPQFTAGPPVAGGERPVGYSRVTYFCANNSIGFTSPAIAQRNCYRSLDGGGTFTPRSVILRSSAPVHPECGQGENLSAEDGHYPQAAPDGSLYLMISCGDLTVLAKSTDEALTFPVLRRGEGLRTVPLPPAQMPDFNTSALQVLSNGTLVVTSLEAGRLKVRVSADQGLRWSAPVDVTAPGLASAATWAVSARGTSLGLAYLGSRHGDPAFYGYVALLRDPGTLAQGRGVTVQSGLVKKTPLLFGSNALGPAVLGAGTIGGPLGIHLPFPPPFTDQVFGNDFIGSAVGPDGTPWGSFTQDCGPSPEAPGCTANGGQTRGLVGRLVATPATSAATAPVRATPRRPARGVLAATGGLPVAAAGLVLLLAGVAAGRRRATR